MSFVVVSQGAVLVTRYSDTSDL